MGTSQIVTKSWNAQPDGRPGGPRKPREGPEAPESPGSLGGPRKPRRAPEGPGKPRRAPEGPGRPGEARKPRKASEAPEGPGRPGKARKTRERPRKASEASEGPGGPGKAPEGPRAAKDPARKPERPCRAVCPEGGRPQGAGAGIAGARPAEGRRRDCRCTACGGQASPLFPTPPQAGCGQGGCGLAPVQGRLSASLKQVPGCLKGRCPATWVHERAEIAPNRAQRQRPAASGRSRGDCPRCRVKIQPQGAFFGA